MYLRVLSTIKSCNSKLDLTSAFVSQSKSIVMDREKLMNIVCGYEYVGETNIIDVYIRYLRTKIDDRFGIKLITTVRGVGYVIRES